MVAPCSEQHVEYNTLMTQAKFQHSTNSTPNHLADHHLTAPSQSRSDISHTQTPSQSWSAHLTHSNRRLSETKTPRSQTIRGATSSCITYGTASSGSMPQPSLGSPTNRLFGCCQQSSAVCILQDARVVVPPQRLIAPKQQCAALLHQQVGVRWAQLTPCISTGGTAT